MSTTVSITENGSATGPKSLEDDFRPGRALITSSSFSDKTIHQQAQSAFSASANDDDEMFSFEPAQCRLLAQNG